MLTRLLLLSALCAASVFGQAETMLKVKLTSEQSAIAPGKPFTVAVTLAHAPKAHSYWLNPGGPGRATSFAWTLPEGFSAGEPIWPVPHKMKFLEFINYGYENEAHVLVDITPPAALAVGEKVPLAVKVNALVCRESCMPVKADASLELTAAAEPVADPASAALFTKARNELPVGIKGWSIAAEKTDGAPQLRLTPGDGANADPGEIYFFSQTADIDSQKAQEVRKDGKDFLIPLSYAEDETPAEALTGLLTAANGWLAGKPDVKAFTVALTPGAKAPVEAAVPAPAPPAGDAATSGLSTPTLLLFAFIGGLILNIMPCVFPVIGLKIMGFVQQAGESRGRVIMHGVAYTLGVLVCFWVLALLVKLLGLTWGGQLQSAGFVLVLAYFFVVFGLNMAGVFEIGTSAVSIANTVQHQSGLARSFFDGLLATVVATPCSAPFLGPALTWATSLSTGSALLVFTVIGLGLSTPYLVLSVAPGLVKLLPRPGAWMESFKQGMSFLLIGTAGYMLFTLAALVPEISFLLAIQGAVLLAFGCWVYGRWVLPHRSATARRTGLIVAVLSVIGSLWMAWPPAKTDSKLQWAAWTPDLVPALVDEGELVYVDFTARWCVTCQVNKHVYNDPKIIALFEKHGIKTVKADWTDNNPEIAKELSTLQRAAIPVNVIYSLNRPPIIVNDDNLFASEIIEALAKLGKT